MRAIRYIEVSFMGFDVTTGMGGRIKVETKAA